MASEAPSVDGLPVVGSSLSFMRDPFGFYARMGERGDVARAAVFGKEVYYAFRPEHAHRVLVEDHATFAKPAILTDATDEIAPASLVAVEGDQWRRLRGVVQPAFTARAVQSYADAVVEEAAALVDGWDDGERVDLLAASKELTIGVLGRALFGSDFAAVADTMADATAAINDRLDVSSVSRFLPTWVPTPQNRRFVRAMDDFDAVIDDLVAERRAREDYGDDLLGHLLEASDDPDTALSDDELRDQLFTFLFAGHETSSLALAYTWFLLAQHPAERERLHAEADALDGDPGVGADLPYTERVVDEGLRLYPPAFALFREPTEDVTLGGYRVPEGAQVVLPTYFVHRDERWWDAPEQFRPDRFREDPDPEYSYFPFGGGPRACIGARFATLELRLALATMARRVTLDLPADQPTDLDLRMSVTLQPGEAVEAVVRTR